ncbi:MAG: tetratricopeptide repeat protein [Holophagales bacterium]|nr:tetratricopeptide repeat protein [Holophagales bacterium]
MEKKAGAALGAALLLAVVASYLPVFAAGFIWNDPAYVTENRTLDGSGSLSRIWTDTRANEQYYPLVFTTYWIEKRLWGLHPLGYHVVNVLLHGIGALLLWRLLRRLALPGAWLAAAAFALHPVCVESVAWVTERKNTLSLVLSLLAAHAFLAWRDSREAREAVAEAAARSTTPRKRKAKEKGAPPGRAPFHERPAFLYGAALAAFSLALFAKTTASVLPAVLLVVVWWRHGRVRWRDAWPLLPFFVVGVGLSFHTAWLERTMVRATGDEWAHGLLERVVLAGQTTTFYATKILWPSNLMFIYPRWSLDAGSLRPWLPALGWSAALGGAALLARYGRRGPLAGLLLFGGVLFPAMGFFNVYAMRYSWVADHFAYQAVAVAAAVLVCGAASLLAPLPPLYSRLATGLGLAGLFVLATLTFRQGPAYKDEETLWRHTLERNAECFICLTNYGNLLLEAGKTDEAVSLLTRSLAIKPDAVPTRVNLARVAEERRSYGEAATHLLAALAVDPSDDEVRIHLATVYTKAGRLDDGIREFRKALETPSPSDFLAHNGLGAALMGAGRPTEAIGHFRECVRLRPDYEHGRANLERALAMTQSR